MPHVAHAWGSCFCVCDLCPSAIHSHLGSAGGIGVCGGGVRVPELVSLPLASPLGFTLPRGKGRFFLLGNLSQVRCSFSHVTLPLKQSQLPC